ncbi:MAG: DNA polymerase III subunit delta [Coriobacteriales bacterium]|jgi:DNA polymerase-3 subunit delta|nr:DNA polymerase III subunit delta [Coriobacteriales bacterium]
MMVSTDKKPLLAAYLLNGDDELKVKMMLERLTDRMAELGDPSFNQQTFIGGELRSSHALLDALNTLPFAAEARLVVLKDVDSAPKHISEALVDYLKAPMPTTVLVLCARSLAKNTRIFKAVAAIGEKAIIDCSAIKRSELPDLIVRLARTKGMSIDRAAGDALIERIGTSTVALSNEIERLSSILIALGRDRIRTQDVDRNVARLVEPKPWDLTDALALRNLAVCLQLLNRIEGLTPAASLNQTILRLYAQCLTKLREILSVQSLKSRGVVDIPGALKRPEWQLRTTMRGAGIYDESELIAILHQAPETEQRMKSRPETGREMERWLMRVCGRSQAF